MINILLNLYNFDEEWCFEALKNVIKDNHKVLIIPFSFHDGWIKNDSDWQKAYNSFSGKNYKDIILPFLTYGITEGNINWVNYFKDTKESAKDKVKNSDIIFFTGGLPDKMMCRLEQFDLIKELENYPGIIMGSSAGAMVQIANYHITPDEDYDTFSYNKGLNLINDFDIEVHYEETDLQNNCIKKVLNEKTATVYAIKNTGGLIIDNNVITLLGGVTKFNR
jgi:peptidase E